MPAQTDINALKTFIKPRTNAMPAKIDINVPKTFTKPRTNATKYRQKIKNSQFQPKIYQF